MKKKRKDMLKMSITIGLVAALLVFLIFMQFKTVDETDITGIETMREAELRQELATWNEKYEDTLAKIEETENKIDEYTLEIDNNNNLKELLNEEISDLEMYAGYTDVTGEGIEITLTDTDSSQIVSSDLITLINELKLAGAEAISVNDERVVSTTDIVDINYQYIVMNVSEQDNGVTKLSSPYVVKAIGDKKYLESAITIKYGYLDSMNANAKQVDYKLEDNIEIKKYSGDLSFKYAQDVE